MLHEEYDAFLLYHLMLLGFVFMNKKIKFTLPLAIASSVLVLIVSVFFYNIYISDKIDDLSQTNLESLLDNNAGTFRQNFEFDTNLLESSASLLPVWDYLRYINFESDHYRFLSRSFNYMVVINPYGYGVGSDSEIGDLAAYDFFHEAMNGQTVIEGPLALDFNNQEAIILATPMIAYGETRGVLAGLIYIDTLNAMLGDNISGVKANLIVDSEGNIIANNVNDSDFIPLSNLYSRMEKGNIIHSDEFESFKQDITNATRGRASVHFDGESHSILYKPVGIQDWMIMYIIPEAVTQSTTNNIVIVTAIISVFVMLVVSVFGFIINSSQSRTLARISEIAYVSQIAGINTLIKFKLDSKDFMEHNSTKKFLLIKFDVEKFRLINEALGEKEGDKILKYMAKAIEDKSNSECLCAHIHSDEFLVMLTDKDEKIENWSENYQKRLYALLGENFHFNLRIVMGVYYFDAHSNTDISTAIERVNIAHHYAKETKSLISVYSEEFLENEIKVKAIENRMEKALDNKEFVMFLQPELDLKKDALVGAEALVRWKTPEGMMRPDEFIPIFEQNGFIIKLDLYMFEQACNYLRAWIAEGREAIIISVNFSRKHIFSSTFVANLTEICKRYEISPQYLGIEITESSMLENEADLINIVHDLREKGFLVLMDDFGSGYSSLGLLKNIPINVLKLDKSFFSNIEAHDRSIAVVNSAIQLAKNLKLETVAEGVETLEILEILKKMGCDIIQGYYYAKPLEQDDFKEFYDKQIKSTLKE